jgi:peptidoglycan/xylan/chitin deacetylase (PgdA/CDA1 family)
MPANSTSIVNALKGGARELKRDALSVMLSSAHRLGVDRLIALHYGGRGSILTFHSVVKDIDQQLGQSIHVQDYVLREIVRYLRTIDRDIVTLDEGMRRLMEPTSRRFVVLTFDDGYRNNLTNALPVLQELDAPFTVYVNSNMLSGEIDLWWLGLRDLLLVQDLVEIEPMNLKFSTACVADKCKALLLITDWVHRDVQSNAKSLKGILTKYGIDMPSIARREALDLENLKSLSGHDLVTIGGHAETHQPLNSLDEIAALGEMVRNKQLLENVVQSEVRHFAYPFGESNTAGVREARIAQSSGFETAVTTCLGNLFKEHAARPFLLPRLTVLNQDRSAQVAAKLAGVEKLIRHPTEKPFRTY